MTLVREYKWEGGEERSVASYACTMAPSEYMSVGVVNANAQMNP